MRSASFQPSSYEFRPSLRHRATATLLALGLVAAVLWMLFALGVLPPIAPPAALRVMTLKLPPALRIAPSGSRSSARPKHTHTGGSHPAPTPAPVTATPPAPPLPWNVIPLNSQELAASDISKMPTRSAAPPAAAEGDGGDTGDSRDSASGPGAGPGGERLYNADWYPRPPSDAELAYYMPKHAPPTGYADIACRTVERDRVEDCRELDETPGSGYARAIREAAWQFHVRPPRVGGREMVGAWVRIHFTFTERGASAGG